MNDSLNLRGDVCIKLNDEIVLEKKNLIVNTGKNFLASAVINSSTSPFTYMAIGTNTTAAAVGDTSLGSELVRQAFTSSIRLKNAQLRISPGKFMCHI